jgi:hypothetical protein
MWQLYIAVAIPKMTHCADIWYTPVHMEAGRKTWSGSIGLTTQLAKVQCMGTLAITGALRSTATDILDLHANLLPTELLFHKVCHSATLRLKTLPPSHPLHKPVHACDK